jgi:fructose-1,6-bisphosphatase/inositol monophosphatase family enzyme
MENGLSGAVHAIMREAAERAILPRYRALKTTDIIQKATDDLVTIADREAEDILSEALTRLLPEARIVGEEAVFADAAVLDRLAEDLCWIVDPLDGTNNFASGKAPFGILIALAEKGETIGGWLYDPLSGRFCHATKGGGAFIDGQSVRAKASGNAKPIAAISLIYMDPAQHEAVKAHIAPHYELVDIPRCAAEQYPRLVLGRNDVSIFERTLPWDHAAGVLFLNEAGGKAARPDGSPYLVREHDRTGMIGAATPELWDELAERMAKL